jgi:hypothetical protein
METLAELFKVLSASPTLNRGGLATRAVVVKATAAADVLMTRS